MFADLHIHSWHSDGTLSLKEIIEKARAQNITLISICDHNLIDAYADFNDIDHAGIRIITGVEINSVINDAEYHILAYGFDMQDENLIKLLHYNRNILNDMGKNLIKQISMNYPSISLEEFQSYERNRKNGGWESLDYLKSKGIIKDVSDYLSMFNKYSNSARKWTFASDKDFLHPSEIIKIIHNAGGRAVLAHLGESIGQNLELCGEMAFQFLDMGIDGFECYYPTHTDEITEFLVKLCHEHNLMITVGSDEHGGFNGCEYFIGSVKIEITKLRTANLNN